MSTASVINIEDHEKPSASLVYVTPDMAKRWLSKNTGNRPVKKAKVAQYARDMAEGRWEITGEAVKFAQSGRLIDGQNRLHGVIASGATVPMFVMRGIAESAQLVMDSGAPRSTADALGFLGHPGAKDLAPAASALKAWRSGFFPHCMHQSNPGYTKQEIAAFVADTPSLAEVTPWVKRVQRELPLPIGTLAACAHEFMLADADTCAEFFDRIHEMDLGPKADPINTLVRRVALERDMKKRVWVSTGIYFMTRAWNAHRAGETLAKFSIGSDARGWAAIPAVK